MIDEKKAREYLDEQKLQDDTQLLEWLRTEIFKAYIHGWRDGQRYLKDFASALVSTSKENGVT